MKVLPVNFQPARAGRFVVVAVGMCIACAPAFASVGPVDARPIPAIALGVGALFALAAGAGLYVVLQRARAREAKRAIEFERLQAEKRRLESVEVLTGGLAHDFNNLLTVILGQAGLLRVTPGASRETIESLDAILGAGSRAAELCRQMLQYSGRDAAMSTEVDAAALLRQVAAEFGARSGSVSLELPPESFSAPVMADSARIQQLFRNLLQNAHESIGETLDGKIEIEATERTVDPRQATEFMPPLRPGKHYWFSVRDDGEGISADVLKRICEPFFSTRGAGRGLGLPVVIGILRACRGGMRVESSAGKGACFHIVLPAIEVPAPRSPSRNSRPTIAATAV